MKKSGNIAGLSNPSNIVGPISVTSQALIDDMSNYGKLYNSKNITIETGDAGKFKEAISRIDGKRKQRIDLFCSP